MPLKEQPAWSVLSSAKLWTGFEVERSRSFLYVRKRVGESAEPRAAPAFIEKYSERAMSAIFLIEW